MIYNSEADLKRGYLRSENDCPTNWFGLRDLLREQLPYVTPIFENIGTISSEFVPPDLKTLHFNITKYGAAEMADKCIRWEYFETKKDTDIGRAVYRIGTWGGALTSFTAVAAELFTAPIHTNYTIINIAIGFAATIAGLIMGVEHTLACKRKQSLERQVSGENRYSRVPQPELDSSENLYREAYDRIYRKVSLIRERLSLNITPVPSS